MSEPPYNVSRPDVPRSYGLAEARSGKDLLDWSFVDSRMAASRNYWVASTTLGGKPHVVPVWGIWSEGAFYFATDRQSRKARNIRDNPEVVIHLESGDEVVIVEGLASEVSSTRHLEMIDKAYHAKYSVHIGGNPAFEVKPHKALAWSEGNYPGSATKWQFR